MSLAYFKKKQLNSIIFWGTLTILIFGSIFTYTYMKKVSLEKENSKLIVTTKKIQKETLEQANIQKRLDSLESAIKKVQPREKFPAVNELQKSIKKRVSSNKVTIKPSIPKHDIDDSKLELIGMKLTFEGTPTNIRNDINNLVNWQNCHILDTILIKGGKNNINQCSLTCIFALGDRE